MRLAAACLVLGACAVDTGEAIDDLKSDAEVTYHGGQVLSASKPMAIFWGSEWSSKTFAGDKITGIDTLLGGWNNSGYANSLTEYNVTASATYLGHTIDTSAAPKQAINSNTAIAEACKVTNNNPDPAGVYLLYTSTGTGTANYCGWHDWGACSNGAPVQVVYVPNLDGVAICDAQDTVTGHSPGLAAIANVSAHEVAETITDPRGKGWYDSGHAEVADKCIETYAASPVVLSNRSQWKLQMEWSNAAYLAGTGTPNAAGDPGCI